MKFQLINFLFLLLIFFLIFFRYLFTRPVYKDGDNVRITAKVLSEPIVYDTTQYIKLKGLTFYLPKYPEINYGDKIIIEGVVDGKRLKDPRLKELLTEQKGTYKLREKIISFYKSSLPEPYSSLVAGIVLGSKQMPENFWQKLKLTGTAHIVVASGTNVTMLASFLILILTRFINRKFTVFMTIAGILLYVILSGFDAPIIRASLMAGVTFLAQLKGRLTNTIYILFLTASLMLFIKPDYLTDLGFILSFVATFSLILFQKKIDSRLKFIPNFFREGLSTSLSAQLGVAPILFVTFGQFSLISPFINALILWTIPFIMTEGMIAGIVGLIIPVVGRLILFIIFPLLYYFVQVITIFN